MNVLHVSSECYPLSKLAGWPTLSASLPLEIKRLRNVDVRVALPLYKTIIDRYQDQLESLNFPIDLGAKKNVYVGVKTLSSKVSTSISSTITLFGSREQVYDYGDEAERFAFSIRCSRIAFPHSFSTGYLHVHDWHTAMIPCFSRPSIREH